LHVPGMRFVWLVDDDNYGARHDYDHDDVHPCGLHRYRLRPHTRWMRWHTDLLWQLILPIGDHHALRMPLRGRRGPHGHAQLRVFGGAVRC